MSNERLTLVYFVLTMMCFLTSLLIPGQHGSILWGIG